MHHTLAVHWSPAAIPTVALIQGICVGGGLEIAALVRPAVSAAESSRFGVPINRNWGWSWPIRNCAGLLRFGRAGAYSPGDPAGGADLRCAEEAREKGLVTRVVADDNEVEARSLSPRARRIAEGAPLWSRAGTRSSPAGWMDPAPLTAKGAGRELCLLRHRGFSDRLSGLSRQGQARVRGALGWARALSPAEGDRIWPM